MVIIITKYFESTRTSGRAKVSFKTRHVNNSDILNKIAWFSSFNIGMFSCCSVL